MTCINRKLLWTLLLCCLPAMHAGAQESHAGHEMKAHMDDDAIYALLQVDRLEMHGARGETPFVWDAHAWIGKDRNRLYLRSEGEAIDGSAARASVEALWARPVSRWWNLAVGVRQDVRPESSRSWLGVGAVGLAPYRVHVEATAYLGDAGRTALRLETEYDLLLTNRLILQPRLELNAYGKDDRTRGIGSGLANLEAGVRLRYELRREIAPYVGVVWSKAFGATADIAQAAGRDARELQAVAGLRVWF
ncbi:MAG TPA: copper resistance protein B [Steroidobacteraceae bacterium]|jgi:copper resistance protein B|nr:copper resistance protein B [Steroidobacteraceae bacterium]